MLKKYTVQKYYKKLTRTPKQKDNARKKRLKKLQAKREQKKQMISLFGKIRYYLALIFGEWVLWV